MPRSSRVVHVGLASYYGKWLHVPFWNNLIVAILQNNVKQEGTMYYSCFELPKRVIASREGHALFLHLFFPSYGPRGLVFAIFLLDLWCLGFILLCIIFIFPLCRLHTKGPPNNLANSLIWFLFTSFRWCWPTLNINLIFFFFHMSLCRGAWQNCIYVPFYHCFFFFFLWHGPDLLSLLFILFIGLDIICWAESCWLDFVK